MNTSNANLDYERAILSGIIFDPNMMLRVQALGMRAGDFYHPFHSRLFESLEYLYENSAVEENIIKQHMGKTFDEVAMLDVLAASPITQVEVYIEKL